MPLRSDAERVMRMFSHLIGQQLEREQLMQALRAANEQLASNAMTDAVTGLPNRRALTDALARRLSHRQRDGSDVLTGLFPEGGRAQGQLWRHLYRTSLLWEAYALVPDDLALESIAPIIKPWPRTSTKPSTPRKASVKPSRICRPTTSALAIKPSFSTTSMVVNAAVVAS